MKTKMGSKLIEILNLCYKADRPVLLCGPHGIGKSEIVRGTAKSLDMECVVRDLALMEPTDLIGMPVISDSVTKFAAPSFLPTGGKGLFLLEELNRSPRYMLGPCMELLTSRTLNDYKLPQGWLPVAAINPAQEGYQVNELDAALLDRFVKIDVVPDPAEWLKWAHENGVHKAVCRYVKGSKHVFDTTSPRSWKYVSDLLHAYEGGATSVEVALKHSVAGLVGDAHAAAFVRAYRAGDVTPEITVEDVLAGRRGAKTMLRQLADAKQTDILSKLAHDMQVMLQHSDQAAKVRIDSKIKGRLESFIKALPADLGRKVRQSAREGGALV